jgi:hypothetical protein
MYRSSVFMLVLGTLIVGGGSAARADSAENEAWLASETPRGFHWSGPYHEADSEIVYQKPHGDYVWNGRWYVYREARPYYARGAVISRSY